MIKKQLKKIGIGWQYSVYDLGNGRVYKKFNSYWESFGVILKNFPHFFWKIPILIKEMKNNTVRSLVFLEEFLTKHPNKIVLFGNFKRINKLDFEQDKVTPLSDYLKNHSIEENKVIIDKFVELNKLFFDLGFMDKALKVGKNFGINQNGQIILMDIGEIWFEEKGIKKQIEKKVWRKWYEVRQVPFELRKYYIQKMDEVFLD